MAELSSSPEKTFILQCCNTSICEASISSVADILKTDTFDWSFVINTAKLHDISGFIYKKLDRYKNEIPLPSDILSTLGKEYHKTAYINTLFMQEYDYILEAFNKKNIKSQTCFAICILLLFLYFKAC